MVNILRQRWLRGVRLSAETLIRKLLIVIIKIMTLLALVCNSSSFWNLDYRSVDSAAVAPLVDTNKQNLHFLSNKLNLVLIIIMMFYFTN